MNPMDFAYFAAAFVFTAACVFVFRYWNKQRRATLEVIAQGWRDCASQWLQCANEHAEKARIYATMKDFPAHFEHLASRHRCAQNALLCILQADTLNPRDPHSQPETQTVKVIDETLQLLQS